MVIIDGVLKSLKAAYTWLFTVFAYLWDTIESNPLLFTVTIIFLTLSLVLLFGLLIISISPSVFGLSLIHI